MLTAKLVSRASRVFCLSTSVCSCVCAEMPGVLTAKLVSRASRVSSKVNQPSIRAHLL